MALSVGFVAVVQHNLHLSELKSESTRLFRIASQRADQHDAHLTALAVIARAAASQRQALFSDISMSIKRFYPRIDEMQIVLIDGAHQLIGTVPLEADTAAAISLSARESTEKISLLPHPEREGHYLLIKRSTNAKSAMYAMVLGIDAKILLSSQAEFWSRKNVAVQLTLPNGINLIGSELVGATQFSKPLTSASQPLNLGTAIHLGISDLLPLVQVIGTMLIVSLLYLAALLALRQRERVRVAEQVAELREMETKLAHASRVNSMGEMASGMAHELTQPLTAILAQVQAGLRVLRSGDVGALESILQDTVAQSRRASLILERLRNWSRPKREKASALDLLDVLRNVHALLAPKADQRGVQLEFQLPVQSVVVLANQVEMEQVVYNIVQNAFEAIDGVETARIDVTLNVTSDQAVLEISDNGPGVPADITHFLFTPFFTTRDNGTGLGLTLSQMLVERANGEIFCVDAKLGAIFRVVLPLDVLRSEVAE